MGVDLDLVLMVLFLHMGRRHKNSVLRQLLFIYLISDCLSQWGIQGGGRWHAPLTTFLQFSCIKGLGLAPPPHKSSQKSIRLDQWQIQEFPDEGVGTPKGAPTYYLTNFSRKLDENKDFFRGRQRPPPRSANVDLQ